MLFLLWELFSNTISEKADAHFNRPMQWRHRVSAGSLALAWYIWDAMGGPNFLLLLPYVVPFRRALFEHDFWKGRCKFQSTDAMTTTSYIWEAMGGPNFHLLSPYVVPFMRALFEHTKRQMHISINRCNDDHRVSACSIAWYIWEAMDGPPIRQHAFTMVGKSFGIPAILFYLASGANKNKWGDDNIKTRVVVTIRYQLS